MKVTGLFRHPLKSHGREALERVQLQAGQAMPFDRLWAVAHDNARINGPGWAPCQNFQIGTRFPRLAAINATLDEAREELTLTHPDLPELTFNPDRDGATFIDWVRPLIPENRSQPERVMRLDQRGWTDTDYASVSIGNLATHRAVEEAAGTELSPDRWRLNIWVDGAAWEEMNWAGREITIGEARLAVREPAERCLHTAANPRTGARDVDTLGVLEQHFGHQDFGMYAQVVGGGSIALGDAVTVS